jgi:predicted amidohydrolase YtcJ
MGVPTQDEQSEDNAPQLPQKTLSADGWKWKIFFAICSLGLALFMALRRRESDLPQSYALCSHQGDNIYIVDAGNARTECIVVEGAHIVNLGPLETVQAQWYESRSSILEIRTIPQGAMVVPGISDSHAHILEYGAARQLPLEGAKSIRDAVARVRQFILDTPDIHNDTSKVITGGGWDHTAWFGWPSAADLDADDVVRGRPIVLQSKDCHALWVSSRMLEISMPFPESVDGGIIFRNGTGHPSGVLLDNAQELLKQPKLTESELLRRFKVTLRDAHRYGLTSIHDAGLDPASLAFFKRQAENGVIPIRIFAMVFFDENEPYWGNLTRPQIEIGNGRLTARSVKMFADGALRTGGAALFAPYHDQPSTSGFMRSDPRIFHEVIPKFLKDGWQVNVHAVGDRANSIILDAFEKGLEGANVSALRPRLEHAQMMTSEDMIRLGKLGVIASVQPTHAISDMWFAEDRLGPERIKNLYAFRSIIDSGARITLGSDFPVETMNPFAAFYAAITRKSPTGNSPHGPNGWFPEQRLTREEALRGITIDPAYASFTDDTLGSLEIGKRADFVVLSQNIMEIPPEDILNTKVYATVLDGRPVYGNI